MATAASPPFAPPPTSQVDGKYSIGAGHPAAPMVVPVTHGGLTINTSSSVHGQSTKNGK